MLCCAPRVGMTRPTSTRFDLS